MLQDKIEEYIKANSLDPRFIFIHNDPKDNQGVVPIWLISDEDITHSGAPLVWDCFEVFRKSTRDDIDEWIQKTYKGHKVNFYITHMKPEFLYGQNFRR